MLLQDYCRDGAQGEGPGEGERRRGGGGGGGEMRGEQGQAEKGTLGRRREEGW